MTRDHLRVAGMGPLRFGRAGALTSIATVNWKKWQKLNDFQGGLAALAVGSVTRKVLHLASKPVVCIKADHD